MRPFVTTLTKRRTLLFFVPPADFAVNIQLLLYIEIAVGVIITQSGAEKWRLGT